MKGRSLKIGCKLMVVVWLDQWLDLLLVLVNMSGLFHFHGMEAFGKQDPEVFSYASYEHFGTKKGLNEVCELLDIFFEGAVSSGCAIQLALVLQ